MCNKKKSKVINHKATQIVEKCCILNVPKLQSQLVSLVKILIQTLTFPCKYNSTQYQPLKIVKLFINSKVNSMFKTKKNLSLSSLLEYSLLMQ
jgi:hypothetical protein